MKSTKNSGTRGEDGGPIKADLLAENSAAQKCRCNGVDLASTKMQSGVAVSGKTSVPDSGRH